MRTQTNQNNIAIPRDIIDSAFSSLVHQIMNSYHFGRLYHFLATRLLKLVNNS